MSIGFNRIYLQELPQLEDEEVLKVCPGSPELFSDSEDDVIPPTPAADKVPSFTSSGCIMQLLFKTLR